MHLLNEFDIIAQYFAPLSGRAGLGLRDDAALIEATPGYDLVITKDILVEGRHFFEGTPPKRLARKALGVNLSDLAAKGAEPLHYFLGLVLPDTVTETWLMDFSRGLGAYQSLFGLTLDGGDTTATNGPLIISITMVGRVPSGAMTRRSGAKVGDDLYVTGTLGDSALGLHLITEKSAAYPSLVNRYYEPQPRVAVGQALRGIASACADVSDGLLADAGHICVASGVGAQVQAADLPLSTEAKHFLSSAPSFLAKVYSGGDDYELVFTAPVEAAARVKKISEDTGVQITKIGEIMKGSETSLVDKAGNLVHVETEGYRHFE